MKLTPLRHFDVLTQRSIEKINDLEINAARELILKEDELKAAAEALKSIWKRD